MPELLQDTANEHQVRNTLCISGEPVANVFSQLSDNDGEHEYGENVSELEKDILLDLLSAHSLNSVYQYLSLKPVQPEVSQELE